MIEDKPSKIAAGAALGVFFGIMPGGIAVALVVAALLGLNKKAATITVLATNTWTSVVLLPVFALVGSRIMGKSYLPEFQSSVGQPIQDWRYFFTEFIFYDITLPLIIGMGVVSLGVAIIAFFSFLFGAPCVQATY